MRRVAISAVAGKLRTGNQLRSGLHESIISSWNAGQKSSIGAVIVDPFKDIYSRQRERDKRRSFVQYFQELQTSGLRVCLLHENIFCSLRDRGIFPLDDSPDGRWLRGTSRNARVAH